jgi:osmoprotectant transport system permease protein
VSVAAAPARPRAGTLASGNRVLLLLAAIGLVAAACFPILTRAPNRLVSGTPVPFEMVAGDWRWLALVPAALLLPLALLPRRRPAAALVVAVAGTGLAGLVWFAGSAASALASSAPAATRIGLGAGFWVLAGALLLALADALGQLASLPIVRVVAGIAAIGPSAALISAGCTEHLSILREYAAGRAAFDAALLRHLVLVLGALLPTLAIGLPLGLLAARRAALRAPLFAVLNVIQTIPAIAMFGLLMPLFGGLARIAPGLQRLGIGAIGMAPAIVALVLYALLPIARNAQAGIAAVPASVLETARGMGMTARQILLRVEIPLALPVVLAGVRITLVQLIGLAMLAALIGAGGLGAIMFQGLFADALDQVLLGVIPLVLLAMLADAVFRLLIALTGRHRA